VNASPERTDPTAPGLARGLEVLRRLAEAWSGIAVALPPGVPSLEAAAERMRNGIAALAEEPLLGGDALRGAVSTITEALVGMEGFEDAGLLGRKLVASPIDWDHLAGLALGARWDALEGLDRALGFDSEPVLALLDYAVRPTLRAAAHAVQPVLATTTWARGSCPTCGAPPLLSVTTGREASRFLLCGRCGTSWAWPRVHCASCGESDHRRLGYLHGRGEGDYRRVEVCDTCQGYLKTISVLDLPDPDRLLRIDLETAALDFSALESGYSRR
jgi:hypothetical protein